MDERDWSLSSEDLNASRKRRGSKALELTSPAFSDGGEIPRECGYKNGNQEPPLRIGVVGGKELGATGIHSLALIMDDPDAMEAVGKVWVHWVAWNIEPDADGNANLDNDRRSSYDGYKFKPHKLGTNDFGEEGYGGPAPPDKRHTYVFKVYALDREMDIEIIEGVLTIKVENQEGKSVPKLYNAKSITKDVIEKAMEGHILDQATLTGTYAP